MFDFCFTGVVSISVREEHGLKISLMCLWTIVMLYLWGAFGKPGFYMHFSFYQGRVLGNLTTSQMIAFACVLNAIAFGFPGWEETEARTTLEVIVGILDILIALVYIGVVGYVWFGDFTSAHSTLYIFLGFLGLSVISILLGLLALLLLWGRL